MISSQLLATVPDPLRPALLLAKTKQTVSQWPVDLVYGFIMDDVHSLRTYGILRVHSDPFVTPFPDGIRVEELDNLGIPPATDNTAEQNTHQKRHAPASDNPQSSRSTPGVEHPDQNRIESESKVHKLDNPSASVHQLLRLFGQFHTLVLAPELQAPDELIVRVGNSQRCLVTSVIDTEIRCDLDQSQLISTEDYPVEVQFGRFLIYRPGRVRFVRLGHTALRNNLVIGLTAVVVFLTLVALIAFAIWRRFNRHKRDYQVRLGQKYAEHESRVLRVFREDFMELQSNMQELSQEVKKHNLPYRDYRTFCLFSLFPEYHCELMIPVDPHTCGIHSTVETNRSGLSIDDSNQSVPTHPLLSPFIVPIESHDAASRGISLFNELICNHQFLCLCIRVLEEDERITARDKSRIASLLCAALQPKMVYLTRIMCDLMADMLKRLHNKGDNRLPTAFRRAESVVDKMVSNWLSFLLYNFIRNNVGENLFYFYRALLQQLNTGPRDAVTGKARYTLDSSTLLQTELTGKPINLLVVDPQALFSLPAEHMTVRVLDCDTISQAKEKILDAIYKNRPYSSQLKPVQLDLKRMNKPTGATVTSGPSFCHGQIMCDWEIEIQSDTNNHNIGKPPYRLNCIHDYGLIENERVALVVCEHDRIKPMPCTPAPSRVGHTFRSKKSQISSDLGNGSDHLTSPILGESTALSSEALTAKCRPGSSEINAPVSNSVDDYASPRAACSEVHEATYGTVHSPRLPSAHTLRPTGSPDPRLWCHLEYPGVTAGNGALRRSPELSLTRRGRIRKSLELKVTGTRCSHKTKCNCLRKADTTVGRDVSDTDSPRIGSWTSRSRSTRQPPSTTRMDVTGTGDAVVRRPLLDKSGEFQDSHIDKTASRSLRTRVIRSRKSRRCKSSQGSLKRNQTPVGFDRLMESLPKEVFFNRLVLTRLSVLKYMDKLFESIFSSVVQSQSVPSPIKYLFDFLDARAVGLGVQDPKTVHAWKSNCLQMRFWNQLITNLDYIFDIPLVRQTAFERSFHAFSQAMTYACAPTRDKVTSESSCVKVLFAQDIQNQWTRVQNYYREIKAMPEVKTEDMHELLEQHSKYHTNEFNVSWAIFELYTKYVKPCHDTLVAQLQQEALKLAYTYKSDPSLMFGPNKDYPLWNPMQMIDTLNDVKQCMNQAQFRMWPNPNSPSIVAGSTANGLNTHRSSPLVSRMPTLIMHGAQLYHPSAGNVNASLSTCPVYKFPNTNPTWTSSFGSPLGTGTGAQSSVQTNTDYPDTLRSFNTLTTEFAADEQASRNTLHPPPPPIPPNLIQPYHHHHHHHHHHCYDVYDPHGPIRNGHNFVQQPSESECSGLFSPSTPVAGTRPVGELHEQALGTTVGHDIGSECPAAEVHDPPAR
ncbi:Plexin A [Fasciola hepatica]|uniref:Plexin A n=1 Tax=Fasciola hepatica TaxID=6192 RepID=A0A4E0RLH7_FASHE|nr:Plexin A [Fasciola hepatica]